ncbi:MAG: ankyrin repeat domain-containing protein [Chloroflexota bacterium]
MADADTIREFVIAAHGDFEKVKTILADNEDVLDVAHEWRAAQTETALQAAAHTGGREIAEYLLAKGAKPNTVVYAMLGDAKHFFLMLAKDQKNIYEMGAHDLSLMYHAAIGGNIDIIEQIFMVCDPSELGNGIIAAVTFGNANAVKWFVANRAPLQTKDFRGRTPLMIAVEQESDEIVTVLKQAIGESNLEACANCGALGMKYLANVKGSLMGVHIKQFDCKNCGAVMAVEQGGQSQAN